MKSCSSKKKVTPMKMFSFIKRNEMKQKKMYKRNIGVVLFGATGRTTAGGNASGTIAVTNTFQTVFSASTLRTGCLIQNNGAGSMYVSEGIPLATPPTTAKSFTLVTASAPYRCDMPGGAVLTGEIDITGTATQAYYAAQW
jgi:hypothetical protein